MERKERNVEGAQEKKNQERNEVDARKEKRDLFVVCWRKDVVLHR